MLEEMKRITCSSVSNALISALEHADEMENILIVAWNKPNRGRLGGQSFSDKEITTSQCLMLIEQFKWWLMTNSMGDTGDGDE